MNNSVNRHNEGRTAINLLFDMQHIQLSSAPHSQMYSNIPKSCTKKMGQLNTRVLQTFLKMREHVGKLKHRNKIGVVT